MQGFDRLSPNGSVLKQQVALIDYGAGNLHSVENALRKVGADVTVTADPDVLRAADRIVLPGVGSFRACAEGLTPHRLVEPPIGSGRVRLGRWFWPAYD